MRNFIVCDRRGEPLAKVKAENEVKADALALRKIVGAARLVEVKTMAPKDVESRLTESFKQLGLSEASAKVAAARNNVANLREYEVPSKEVGTGNDAHSFVDNYANPERTYYERFRELGLSTEAARIAAKGRE